MFDVAEVLVHHQQNLSSPYRTIFLGLFLLERVNFACELTCGDGRQRGEKLGIEGSKPVRTCKTFNRLTFNPTLRIRESTFHGCQPLSKVLAP